MLHVLVCIYIYIYVFMCSHLFIYTYIYLFILTFIHGVTCCSKINLSSPVTKSGGGLNPLIGEWTVLHTRQAQPVDQALFDREGYRILAGIDAKRQI